MTVFGEKRSDCIDGAWLNDPSHRLLGSNWCTSGGIRRGMISDFGIAGTLPRRFTDHRQSGLYAILSESP